MPLEECDVGNKFLEEIFNEKLHLKLENIHQKYKYFNPLNTSFYIRSRIKFQKLF